MQHKVLKLSFGFLIASLLAISLISAFGVTTPFWDENPLIMYPGQTKDIALVLQNMVGEEDIKLNAEIISGSEIATLTDPDTQYLVPFGRKDIEVNIRITIPGDTPLEREYNIEVSFKQIAEEEGKMVQMAGAVGANIPIIVKTESEVPKEEEKTEEATENTMPYKIPLLILIIVVLLIIGYLVLRKKK